MTKRWVASSADFCERLDRMFPGQPDDVRFLYWNLVEQGWLVREPGGIRLAQPTPRMASLREAAREASRHERTS